MLEVRLLGGLTVIQRQRWVPLDMGFHGRQLLGFLFAYPNTPHRRDAVIDQIWRDVDPGRARQVFNTVLWRLRRLLNACGPAKDCTKVLGSKHEVFLDLAPSTRVDTVEFRERLTSLTSVEGTDQVIDNRPSDLLYALESYRGPFLDGEDAEWIIEERERLHSLFVRAATKLVKIHGKDGRFSEGIEIAKRVLRLDPYREGIHCDLLVLLTADGQRAEAVKTQEAMESRLYEELGILPMPETTALAAMIKTNEIFEHIEELKTRRFSP